MKKKALSLILSAAMALSLTIVPVSAVSVSNFSDVSSDSWYYDSVSYVAEKDYMNGTSATTFEPNGNMTRAMFATVISRVAGAEVDNSAVSEFTDVESGKWYTGAIEWGVENDLLNGYGNGLFGTNNSITRQDICTLTQRFLNWYCEQNNCTLAVDPKVESFTDAASIADYAKEAVEFCRDAGLLTGYEDGSFRPLGTATRAEIAAVIERIEMAIESAEPAGPVVSYTDEDGNKATLAIKAGDVITVDPNGGSVTYDNTTHRDEFTITATEDGITLPNATRSGYRFDGWKVETDANGAYIFTAQWTRTSSGGGGGGGNEPVTPLPDDAVFRDYTISLFNLGKVGSSINGESVIINDGKGTNIYHVAFDSEGNYLEDHSDDILWTDIAKDTFNDANLGRIFNSITLPIKVGNEVVVTEDWIIPEVTVQQVKIVNLIGQLEEEEKEALLDGTPLAGNVDELENILTALDEGNSGSLTSDQVTVVSNISKKLTDMIDETIVDPATGESVNRLYYEVVQRVDQSTLDNLGLDSDDIITMVQDYTAKLDLIVGNRSLRSGRNTDTTDTDTTGGIEVKVNPVNVLKAQYENVDDLLNTALNEVGITDNTKRADVIELLHEANVIDACDPDLFFNPEGESDSDGEYKEYSLLLDGSDVDTQTYSNLIADIIDAVEDARGQLHGVLEDSDIDSVIATILSNVQDKLGEDADSILDKIDANSEKIRDLILQPDTPTLVDVLNISGDARTEGERKVEGSITLEASDINTLLDKILNSSGSEDLQGSELVTSLVNKLSGTYTFGISINVDECSDYDPDTNPDPGVH